MPDLADIIASYFESGYRFHKIEAKSPATDRRIKTVFLIHGWGARAASMQPLARALCWAGYTVFNYDYPSSRRNIEEHAEVFLEIYRQTLRREHIAGKVYFLTHSMGGILLRGAMAKMSEAECRKIEAIVMLGPPNHGSMLAHLGKSDLIRFVNASLADMATDPDSYVRNIPAPPFLPPVGIVAGRFDGKVSLASTLLPDHLDCRRTIVNCTHSGLRTPCNTLSEILRFFREKKFDGFSDRRPGLTSHVIHTALY